MCRPLISKGYGRGYNLGESKIFPGPHYGLHIRIKIFVFLLRFD